MAMSLYGWIGPDGKWFAVEGFACHSHAEPELRERYKFQNVDDIYENCVHVSPPSMRLPDHLTEKHVEKLMEYLEKLEEDPGRFGYDLSYDKLTEGFYSHVSGLQNIRSCVEKAMTRLASC